MRIEDEGRGASDRPGSPCAGSSDTTVDFADAGGADHGEVVWPHRGDMDRRVELSSCVRLPITAGVVHPGIVDADEAGGADAVGDDAEIGIAANAGGESLAAVFVDT